MISGGSTAFYRMYHYIYDSTTSNLNVRILWAFLCIYLQNIGYYNSIGLIIGFLMCLMLVPDSSGLNGAWTPYGLGTGSSDSSSGMYAFGRGSAVVVMPPGIVYKSTSSSAYEVQNFRLFMNGIRTYDIRKQI